jgi:group I intron endonuclease
MFFEYQGFSLKGGIYQIRNVLSGVIYVGSTVKFYDRWNDHKRSLIANKHKTKHLQYAYSKYLMEHGSDDFLEFTILEVMESSTKAERLAREEWWIEKLLGEGIELYNTNKTPTKEPIVNGIMSESAKARMIKSKLGKRTSPATEYKAGNVPWTKENGHDEETRKLIGEKSKAMWENEASAAKLRVSRQSKKFRKARSKDMKASWKATKEERIATLNLPENREANSERVKKQWSDPESRQRILNARNSETSKIKRLISEVGEDKAAKILDAEWMKNNVETLGKKGTAKLLGVHVGTIRRWYAKFFPYEISSTGIEFQQ